MKPMACFAVYKGIYAFKFSNVALCKVRNYWVYNIIDRLSVIQLLQFACSIHTD